MRLMRRPVNIMRKSDFNYSLPPELVAQYPASPRSASRLLHLDGASGACRDMKFADLPALLRDGDLLVFNDTRVIPARLLGHKDSGGRIEVLIERLLDAHRVLAQVRSSKPPRPGQKLILEGGATAVVQGREGEFHVLAFEIGGQSKKSPLPLKGGGEAGVSRTDLTPVRAGERAHTIFVRPGGNEGEGVSRDSCQPSVESAAEILDRIGHVPLPPYIGRVDETADRERYQTVYARHRGAVAAPTAGLHFDEAMLDRLNKMGADSAFVTLHVGAGTFQPLRVDDIREHRMHTEYANVPPATCDKLIAAKNEGRRVVAVGTTAVRALETAAKNGRVNPFEGETNIFIYPGYRFQIGDALLTNFHLPESTLLMLVCAFGGTENVLQAYRHAVEQRYRFYSYGDAMFVSSPLRAS
jgi:S-adenosylmethionine:tRNA ribosyltransferase-isomerase